MVFPKMARPRKRREDRQKAAVYLLAERIIRDAITKGCHAINLRCYPKKMFFADRGAFLDMAEEGEDSPVKMRDHGWVLGVTMGERGKDAPYMSLPVSLFLPLLNLFSEKTMHAGKQGFAVYNEADRETMETLVEVTLYLESDSSLSIDFKKVGSQV